MKATKSLAFLSNNSEEKHTMLSGIGTLYSTLTMINLIRLIDIPMRMWQESKKPGKWNGETETRK